MCSVPPAGRDWLLEARIKPKGGVVHLPEQAAVLSPHPVVSIRASRLPHCLVIMRRGSCYALMASEHFWVLHAPCSLCTGYDGSCTLQKKSPGW